MAMSTAAFSSFLLPTMSMNKMCFSSSSSSSSSSKNNNNNATSMISFSVKNLSRSCRVSTKLSDGSYDTPIDDVSSISYDQCNPIFDSQFDDPVYREALLGNDTFQCADDLEHLAPVVRRRVDAMRNIQLQHSNLEMEYDKELDLLEAKYEKLYQPFYTKRFELVNGIVEVPLAPDELNQVKGVPSFWLTAFKNNDDISKVITESDEEALKYLNDIKWCNIEEPLGFKLDFFFDTNPYFKDTVLTKSYQVITIEDKLLIEKAMGTKIDWYTGMCLTTLKKESFFNFFENKDRDKDKGLLDSDYKIGSGIRYDIIPRAVLWYVDEPEEEDEEGDEVEEEEEEEEEDM